MWPQLSGPLISKIVITEPEEIPDRCMAAADAMQQERTVAEIANVVEKARHISTSNRFAHLELS
jgi:hypothetical protein